MVDNLELFMLFGGIIFCGILTHIHCKDQKVDKRYIAHYRSQCQSSIERKVFDGLVANGHVPVTQLKQGRFSLDLALPKYNLDIECDGEIWHNTPEAIAKDKRRDAFMKSNGWRVLRFTDKEINENTNRVVQLILYEIKHS